MPVTDNYVCEIMVILDTESNQLFASLKCLFSCGNHGFFSGMLLYVLLLSVKHSEKKFRKTDISQAFIDNPYLTFPARKEKSL